MRTIMRRLLRSIAPATILLAIAPSVGRPQAEALTGLLGSATDFDFFGTWVGVPRGDLKPERGGRVAGVGFELAFDIPGGIGRKRIVPKVKSDTPRGTDCESRFQRGELKQDQACQDVDYKVVKRIRARRDTTYEEEAKVEVFKWNEPIVSFELAIGFSQSGALVARESTTQMRASVREAPSVSLYGNVGTGLLAGYFGARTGLVSLVGGRAYIDETAVPFEGSTFQIGPVLGGVVDFRGLSFFAEGAYMWRDIKSIEWDSDAQVGAAPPRSANLSGPSFSLGVQFKFRDADK